MAKAKYLLKEPKSSEDTLIYLVFNYNYKRFKYSTGEKIMPKLWNAKTQRAKETKNFPQYPEFNSRLDIIENGINNAYRRLLNDGIQPDNQKLKTALEDVLSGNLNKERKLAFLEYVNLYIKECEQTKRLGTVKSYKTTFNYLKKYQDYSRKELDFDSITLEFYNKFIIYLTHEYDLSANTVGKHIKTIKIFLNEATERGYNQNLEYRKKKFKVLKEESDNIYLSVDELKNIETLDLSNCSRLDKVRDLFLLGCFTGLRFSDFTQIKQENINKGKSMLLIRTQKTGERVTIPLHRVTKKILEKYKFVLPKAYTNQVMNRYLKELMELAGLNELIETSITKGGVVQKNAVPKYEMVSTHTARRSFATNLYLADVPSISIMKITGHKTEKSFLKYIRITQEQNADKLLNHPFFN